MIIGKYEVEPLRHEIRYWSNRISELYYFIDINGVRYPATRQECIEIQFWAEKDITTWIRKQQKL